MSVRSTIEAALTPIVMAIVSLNSSLVAPYLRAFLIWPSRQPLQWLAKDAAITKTQANEALDSFTKAVADTLKKGGKVTLVGFGTFSVSKRAARNGRNPQTGQIIKIKAKKVAKFKAGKALSDKL